MDEACAGRIESLKERIVGSAVFGRDPGYDTNQDAVVRNAAAEVRKRLAQYYMEPGREAELRVDLPPGSYVPEVHLAPVSAGPVPPVTDTNRLDPPSRKWKWVLSLIGVLLAGAAVYGYVHQRGAEPTDLDRFWNPVLASRGDAQFCIGQSKKRFAPEPLPTRADGELDEKATIPLSRLLPVGDFFYYAGDSLCMVRLTTYLVSRGKGVQVRGSQATTYADLRGKSTVLIGAFNNDWFLRLTEGLRFSLLNSGGQRGVRDSTQGEGMVWSIAGGHGWLGPDDYALVTRKFDPNTEQVVVAAGGIGHFGTQAAGDFLSNPAYFREAVRTAPPGWERKNMQFVLVTKVTEGTPGPPHVLAAHYW